MGPFNLWKNTELRAFVIALWAGFLLSGLAFAQDSIDEKPKLLLTTQLLRRLERDRTRQTVRWLNFENRVNSVPDSPERGFELALYYAVTHDEKRGREAVAWALTQKYGSRQVALIIDWCRELISPEDKAELASRPILVAVVGRVAENVTRDLLFSALVRHQDIEPQIAQWKEMLRYLQNGYSFDGNTIYAICEYLVAVRYSQHIDLRKEDANFFSGLPVEFLLSLKPAQVKHPDWITHIAALALIALDPNLESSQFLQGWALEDSQMIREGPGVAYELLWADPYLPGVGYENLDPWTYDTNGRLFARRSWNSDACWISISSAGVQQENCPSGWQNVANQFGHLTLLPEAHCTDVPHRKSNSDVVILWRLQPKQKMFYFSGDKKESAAADSAGMWRLSENVDGQVCTSLDKLKRP